MSKQAHELSTEDDELISRVFHLLKTQLRADPYGRDGALAEEIRSLPTGLRAMAATHHLDVSLTMDDIGWHFLNFGYPLQTVYSFKIDSAQNARTLVACDARGFALVGFLRASFNRQPPKPKKMKMILKRAFLFAARSLLMPCLLLGLLTGCPSKPTQTAVEPSTPTPIAAELKPLQGYWEGDGAGGKCSITITGDSLHYRAGNYLYKTTFTLPAGTDPQQLHATIKNCSPPSSNAIGTVVFAIFKIEDGTLTLAVDDMSDQPPKTFPGASSRYNLQKVQPQKKNTLPPKTKLTKNA